MKTRINIGDVLIYIPHRLPAFTVHATASNIKEVRKDYRDGGDMSSIVAFPSIKVAQTWGTTYTGHQWVKVQCLIENM